MTDNEIDVGKYQNALSFLCGVDYSYMRGDSSVDAIAELIALAVEQEAAIKRQQAQIERLQADLTRVCAERDARICTNNFIRAEAIKEFAERLKVIVTYIPWCEYPPIHREIDNLVKEMVGGNNDG